MRVDAIRPQNFQRVNLNRYNSFSKSIDTNFVTTHDTVEFKPASFAYITFTGNNRNPNQVSSLAFENKGTGLPEDFQGGMGVVTYEGPKSMIEHENMDVRSFQPFHEHNNHKGGYKFLYTKNIELVDGKLPEQIEAKWFLSAAPGQSIEDFAKSNNYDIKDLRFVIQSEPDGKTADSLSKYCLLDKTGVKGHVERMSNNKIGETEKIYYELFEIAKDNPSYNVIKDKPNYFMYTKELAKTPKPYTYGPDGWGGIEAEIINSDFVRACLDAEKQMNTEKFGNWNPGSYWGHDRPVATILAHMANASAAGDEYYNGSIVHHTAHNTGKNYQGSTDNPFQFARLIFGPKDVEALRNHPSYELLENFNSRGWGNLTDLEKQFVRKAFAPMIGEFVDFFGNYNVTKIAINAKKMNPDNASFGTVSPNFDKEMKNPNMDVAPGIGADIRNIETISPLNGSTPASLNLDNNKGSFGRGNNILTDHKNGFHTFTLDEPIEQIIKKREKNAKWLTDIMNKALTEGQDTLNRVFFNPLQIEQGRSVIGNLSKYKEGEMLLMGWGRPDEQKAFTITLEGLLDFYQRDDVPMELKLKVNTLLGWGDAPFDKGSREWHLIENAYNKIIELEGGAFKGKLSLCDGRFPNKLVGCATHGIFTSRREMCGITPLEAKAAGVPSLVTATGGPVDYINESNGWKTKTAPEMNPPFDGLSWNASNDLIDDTRRARVAKEVSDKLKIMVEEYINHNENYIKKCAKNASESFDWHNNNEFNGGKSANKMYKEDIWKIPQGWEARNKNPLQKLVGSIKETSESTAESINKAVQEALTAITTATNKGIETLQQTGTQVIETIKTTSKSAAEESSKAISEASEKILQEIKENIPKTPGAAETPITNTVQEEGQKIVKEASKTKWGKIIGFGGGAVALLGAGGYYLYNKKQASEHGINKTA